MLKGSLTLGLLRIALVMLKGSLTLGLLRMLSMLLQGKQPFAPTQSTQLLEIPSAPILRSAP
ncbi:MAG: hypothetical protein DCF32_22330 [Leptolyngbya sp.]|nr:MAG: hypothetical protein DCF32_22330 [Leptolyngbya sp.]